MTEKQLRAFVYDIEWHRDKDDVIIFPTFKELQDFSELLPESIFDEQGIIMHMKDGYFCIFMKQICDFCGIKLDRVFIGEDYLDTSLGEF